jgi:hypothetical protein
MARSCLLTVITTTAATAWLAHVSVENHNAASKLLMNDCKWCAAAGLS